MSAGDTTLTSGRSAVTREPKRLRPPNRWLGAVTAAVALLTTVSVKRLAYATTAHRAQGSTVDTAHLLVTDQLTRALLYVCMTRGRVAAVLHARVERLTSRAVRRSGHQPILIAGLVTPAERYSAKGQHLLGEQPSADVFAQSAHYQRLNAILEKLEQPRDAHLVYVGG
jgi:UvrD-like helicase family protein